MTHLPLHEGHSEPEPREVHVRPLPRCLAHTTRRDCPCSPTIKVQRDLFTGERYYVVEHRPWRENEGR